MSAAYPDGQFCIQLNGSTPNPIKVASLTLAIINDSSHVLAQTYDAMLYTIRAYHPSITMLSSPTEVRCAE